MQIWAESGKSALPICNYSQILYQFLTFTQNLKRSLQLSVDELKTLNDAHIIISEMQDATNSESLARLKDNLEIF